MASFPSDDPLHPSMSGDDADPILVIEEIEKLYREIGDRYNTAKFGQDPVGRRAITALATPGSSINAPAISSRSYSDSGKPCISSGRWRSSAPAIMAGTVHPSMEPADDLLA
ncbi:MAG: hypothetical protein M0Z34_11185 [Nitrospiraceae bacterium]|nr:hypothetical protein [Nitrospiraceae bacterium]